MQYISTRGGEPVSAAQAIVRGICPLGGLYVPMYFPQVLPEHAVAHAHDYRAMAQLVMEPYLDIPKEQFADMLQNAYGKNFDTPEIAPLVPLNSSESILELFHGPTLAFKDMALQLLPYLMRDSMLRTGEDKQVYILVATSGDTGKAALAGFCDVPGTAIQVFYPDGGVSHAQLLQMVTQQGKNISVCGVRGNFDDAQTAVKRIFADQSVSAQAEQKGYRLSSANSINFGRLLPQIVYYYAAYARLVESGVISCGNAVNFCVPTGNFGNILAGYYARQMGLPIQKLICASNRNNVLTDFFADGLYDSRRTFYKSMSCSIDILVSSNLERLLFEAAGRDPAQVAKWMNALQTDGYYEVGAQVCAALGEVFTADWCDEKATLGTIRAQFEQNRYLMDPHTAVAQTVLDRMHPKSDAHTVLLSTAHPFKFASDVLHAFEPAREDDFANANRLSELSGLPIPEAIASLQSRPILHTAICDLEAMPRRALDVLP